MKKNVSIDMNILILILRNHVKDSIDMRKLISYFADKC